MAFTFFFRDQALLERVVEYLAPELAGRSRPRIWDAGAAMGQEPFTLAIMLAERLGYFNYNNLRIDATDVEPSFARFFEEAVYENNELTRLPPGICEKYFEPGADSGRLRLIETVRSRVVFQHHDLLSFQEIGHGYSLVLCKNVLLHFSPQQRVEVIRMFHRALAPGGYFATEQTQEMPLEVARLFERVVPNAQLFRKVEDAGCGS